MTRIFFCNLHFVYSSLRKRGQSRQDQVPAAALRRVTGKERSISIGIKRWMLAGCLLLASFRCRRRRERRRRSSMSCRICRFRHGISTRLLLATIQNRPRLQHTNQTFGSAAAPCELEGKKSKDCDIVHVIVEVHCRATLRWQVLRKPCRRPPAKGDLPGNAPALLLASCCCRLQRGRR